MNADRGAIVALVLLAAWAATGCGRRAGPPPIATGTPCAACGMSIQDPRYACERPDGSRWRAYDSIECLLRERGPGGPVWLADYDTRALHTADSMWVARGEFPSPMGGGYAAFLERGAAEEVAARTRGRVDRLDGFLAAGRGDPP